MDPLAKALDPRLEALLPELVTIYKDLHSHPELSMQEARTAKLAAGAWLCHEEPTRHA